MSKIAVGNFFIGSGEPLTLLCGPCVMESEEHTLECAATLKNLLAPYPIQFLFKASYDKANRSSIHSFRGPGLEQGLHILKTIQRELQLPVVTDVHSPEEAIAAGAVCEMIQIPAFLSRQTDLLVAAGSTQAAINVKKGQFLAPTEMRNVVDKLLHAGNTNLLLTDRGTSFGYHNLVVDFRSIPLLQSLGFPVCLDASHAVQLPGGLGTASGGERQFIPLLARAAIAVGCNALFIEAHPTPEKAKSDAATVLSFDALPPLLDVLIPLYALIQRAVCV